MLAELLFGERMLLMNRAWGVEYSSSRTMGTKSNGRSHCVSPVTECV